jgi:hypothetical protein
LKHGLPLRGLAAEICRNHRSDIANLTRSKRPLWAERGQRWTKEQKDFYEHLLELEVMILESILRQASSLPGQAAA